MRAAFALVAALVVLAPMALATPIPESVYRVVATSPTWGPGIGYLFGHPQLGARLWLETAAGTGEWGFSIGGTQTRTATPLGTHVLDQWTGPSYQRFVGGYFEEDAADPTHRDAANLTAWGQGNIGGWVITVVGHT